MAAEDITIKPNIILFVYAVIFAFCIYIVSDSFALVLGTVTTEIGLITFPMISFPKWIVSFENLSFSFYLIHKFIIAVMDKIVSSVFSGALVSVAGVLLSFALTLIATTVSYYLIEKNCRVS